MEITERLHFLISRVCPIVGVSVGKLGDNSSVSIQYDESATLDQKIEAEQIVNDFDWVHPKESFDVSIAEGYLVEPEGFSLKLYESDRIQLSQLLGHINNKLQRGANPNTPTAVTDINGNFQILTYERFTEIAEEYGDYYITLWTQLAAAGG